MKNAWKSWIKISKKLSVFLANILLTIIYVILIPFSFLMQLFFRQSLVGRIDATKKNSFWVPKKKAAQDLTWAKEQ